MVATATPEDTGTTADNLRMGALSERAFLIFESLSGILGKAAVSAAAELVVVTIVFSELILAVVAGDFAAAIKLWIIFALKATNPLEVGTGCRIREVVDELGPVLIDEGGHVKGTAELKLCPNPDSFRDSGALPVNGTTGILLGFSPAFCHDIDKVEINRSSNKVDIKDNNQEVHKDI